MAIMTLVRPIRTLALALGLALAGATATFDCANASQSNFMTA